MHTRTWLLLLALPCAVSLRSEAGHGALEASTTLAVGGDVATPVSWTVPALKSAFQADLRKVSYRQKDGDHEATCVALRRLVEVAKPTVKAERSHHDLAFAVLVSASDGYAAAFSMGELDEALGKAQVWVALDRDGGPLSTSHAPVELLVVSDGKASRWVRAVTSVRVADLSASRPAPDNK